MLFDPATSPFAPPKLFTITVLPPAAGLPFPPGAFDVAALLHPARSTANTIGPITSFLTENIWKHQLLCVGAAAPLTTGRLPKGRGLQEGISCTSA
jgi:hypothetical protein